MTIFGFFAVNWQMILGVAIFTAVLVGAGIAYTRLADRRKHKNHPTREQLEAFQRLGTGGVNGAPIRRN